MRTHTLLITFLLVLTASLQAQPSGYWSDNVSDGFSGGTGLVADPYLISSAKDLAYLAKQVNGGNSYKGKYLSVTAKTLDLSEHYWVPIGSDTNNSFQGNFNGNNVELNNMYIGTNNSTTYKNSGLFGCISHTYYPDYPNPGTVIENLTLSSGIIIGMSSERSFTGGIIGSLTMGTQILIQIKNCTNKALITGGSSESSYIGGIIGNASSSGARSRLTITNCTNEGVITGGISSEAFI